MTHLQRTVEPGSSLLSSAEVRVVIHPASQVPKNVLDEYVNIIKRFTHIPLSAARSSYVDPPRKTPFEYLDWTHGCMHFKFLQADQCRRKSRLADLHRQRQVVAVVGLIYCPTTPSVPKAFQEFVKQCKTIYPEALLVKCLSLEPGEQHLQEDKAHPIKDNVFFAGGQGHFQQHLEVWVHELAALVLTELERWVLVSSFPAPPEGPAFSGVPTVTTTSYTDNPEFTGGNAMIEEVTKRLTLSDDEVQEKKRWARLSKAQGDACFMAGSPGDALEHYRSCADVCRDCNDLVWLGAALEGMAAAKLMLSMSAPPPPPLHASNSMTAAELSSAAKGETGAGGGGDAGVEGGMHGSASVGEMATAAVTQGKGEGAAGQPAGLGRAGSTPQLTITKSQNSDTKLMPRKSAILGFSPRLMWEAVRRSNTEAEVRELLSEARAAYKRRGGCPVLVLEQHLKLIRFIVGVKGTGAARKEVLELVGSVVEGVSALPHPEDKITLLVEAAQVVGSMGCLRRRLLLLWQAFDVGRAVPLPPPPAPGAPAPAPAIERSELLRLPGAAFEPPDDLLDSWGAPDASITGRTSLVSTTSAGPAGGKPPASAHVSTDGGTLSKRPVQAATHFAQRAKSCREPPGRGATWLPPSLLASAGLPPGVPAGMWDKISQALLEAAMSVAWQGGLAGDTLEVAAALLRDHHAAIGVPVQHKMLQQMGQAAQSSPPHVRHRPGPGPALLAQLKRVLPGPEHLQPARLSLTRVGRLTTSGAGAGTGKGSSAGSPFIFSALAPKRQDSSNITNEPALPEWVCGEQCCIEVTITNPMAVPVRLEQVQAVMSFTPSAESATNKAAEQTPANEDNTHLYWQSVHASIMLPPTSKPTRLLILGKPLQPGQYTLKGIRVMHNGSSWLQPLLPPGPIPAAMLGNAEPSPGLPDLPPGRGRDARRPATPSSWQWSLAVTPALPHLQATLTTGDTTLVAPPKDDLGVGSSTSGSGIMALTKPQVVSVWEGQVCSWKLELVNTSTQPITHVETSVLSAKGASLKPLAPGQLHASLAAPHLDLDVSQLVEALPLAPGARVSMPVVMHAGRAPKKTVQEEVTLEVCITYAHVSGSAGAVSSGGTPAGAGGGGAGSMLGRCLKLPVAFRVQSALQILHLTFSDYYCPMRNGVRCAQPSPHNTTLAATPAHAQQHSDQTAPSAALGSFTRLFHALGGPSSHLAAQPAHTQRVAALDLSTSGKLGGYRAQSLHRHSETLERPERHGSTEVETGLEIDLEGHVISESGSEQLPGTFSTSFTGRSPSSLLVSRPSMRSPGGPAASLTTSLSFRSPPSTPHNPFKEYASHFGRPGGLKVHEDGPAAGQLPVRIMLSNESIIVVTLYNDSAQYFRVWLACVAGACGMQQLSASEQGCVQEVVPPKGSVTIWACMARPLEDLGQTTSAGGARGTSLPGSTGGGAGGGASGQLPQEADRLAAAESLGASWAVCYQVISGDEDRDTTSPDSLPHGIVRLAAVDAVRTLTCPAMSILLPAPLHASLSLLYVMSRNPAPDPMAMRSPSSRMLPGSTAGRAVRLRDLARQAVEQGCFPPGQVLSELWGVQVHAGHVVQLEVGFINRLRMPLHVVFSLGVSRPTGHSLRLLQAGAAGVMQQHDGTAAAVHAAEGKEGALSAHKSAANGAQSASRDAHTVPEPSIHPGVILIGGTHQVHAIVQPGQPYTSTLQLIAMTPGFYQVHVSHVCAAPITSPRELAADAGPDGRAGADAAPSGSLERAASSGQAADGAAPSSAPSLTPAQQQQLLVSLTRSSGHMPQVYASCDKLNLLAVLPAPTS